MSKNPKWPSGKTEEQLHDEISVGAVADNAENTTTVRPDTRIPPELVGDLDDTRHHVDWKTRTGDRSGMKRS